MPDPHALPGLPPGSVLLTDHDPRWAVLYAEEAARLAKVLGPAALSMDHYGSTAIPGIKAKPIIDILIGVRRLDDALAHIDAMAAAGYEYAPDAGIPDHHIFGKGRERTHIVHFVEHGGERWKQALRFRDRLRAQPEAAKAYERLKIELASRHPDDRAAYTEGKTDFVERLQAP
jgi:GrpB-like predicted nucleotidyltransferase (UPF0157 family)